MGATTPPWLPTMRPLTHCSSWMSHATSEWKLWALYSRRRCLQADDLTGYLHCFAGRSLLRCMHRALVYICIAAFVCALIRAAVARSSSCSKRPMLFAFPQRVSRRCTPSDKQVRPSYGPYHVQSR